MPKSAAKKMADYRKRKRAQGLRQVTLWVPDWEIRSSSGSSRRMRSFFAIIRARRRVTSSSRRRWLIWRPSSTSSRGRRIETRRCRVGRDAGRLRQAAAGRGRAERRDDPVRFLKRRGLSDDQHLDRVAERSRRDRAGPGQRVCRSDPRPWWKNWSGFRHVRFAGSSVTRRRDLGERRSGTDRGARVGSGAILGHGHARDPGPGRRPPWRARRSPVQISDDRPGGPGAAADRAVPDHLHADRVASRTSR